MVVSKSCWLTGVVAALVLGAVAQPAAAYTFSHNGLIEPLLVDTAFVPGSGDVNVGVHNVHFLEGECPPLGEGDTVCLSKLWFPDFVDGEPVPPTFDTPHVMTIGGLTEGAEILLLEEVLNVSFVDWTDYHFNIEGASIEDGFLFVLEPDSSNSYTPTVVFDSATAFSIFFDPVLGNLFTSDNPGVLIVSLLLIATGDTITISQIPTIPEPATLALLCAGFLSLGAARYRRT
ncbi:MAG: PEP-CTERM sorting domain-containing protein [Mycobacterium sp.]